MPLLCKICVDRARDLFRASEGMKHFTVLLCAYLTILVKWIAELFYDAAQKEVQLIYFKYLTFLVSLTTRSNSAYDLDLYFYRKY